MRILEVIPRDIEVVFSLSIKQVRQLERALTVSEFDLDQKIPEEKATFDTIIEFHETLKQFVKEGLIDDRSNSQ